MLNEETIRIVEKGTCSSHSEVLVTESRGRSKSRGPKKGAAERRSKSRGRNTEIVCFYCHDKGHRKCQCRKWKKEKGKKKKEAHKQDSDSDSDAGRITSAVRLSLLLKIKVMRVVIVPLLSRSL